MEAQKEMTQEEIHKLRNDVAAELDAEEKGEDPPPSSVDESKKETQEEDPWAGVNPALKQAFTNMSQQVATLQNTETRLKQAESRIGALTNELHNAKEAAETVKNSPTKEQMEAAAKSDEAWENLKADFPEWAEAFDGRFNAKIDKAKAEIMSGLHTAEEIEQIKQTLAEGTAEEIQKGILGFVKPNWKATLALKEYQEWIKAQPEDVINLTKSPFAADAITILDAFEESAGKQRTAEEIAAERKRRMKTAIIPQGKKSITPKSESEMTAAELRTSVAKEVWAD